MLRFRLSLFLAIVAITTVTHTSHAQARVGSDSATRLQRLGRDLLYGTVEGLGFAVVDQLRDDPPEWGKGWRGYGKRTASNIGEFSIQESMTEALAALMNRPLDYAPCECRAPRARFGHAVHRGYTDQMPDGTHPFALPRVIGAYAGSFAQAAWRPPTTHSRMRVGLINGTMSLALGVLINLYHEFQ